MTLEQIKNYFNSLEEENLNEEVNILILKEPSTTGKISAYTGYLKGIIEDENQIQLIVQERFDNNF